jgi:hypothetical protein
MVTDGVIALTTAFLSEVPMIDQWRAVIVSACGFPLSMKAVGRNSDLLQERYDWLAWREGLYQSRNPHIRLPIYSDCAIQHTKGVEGFDPVLMKASSAIRYTSTDNWLLIKGVSTRMTNPSQQFPELARKLVYGQLNSHFYGERHCAGCAAIKASADGAPKIGSLLAWRYIGTIHHITTAVEQLSSLTWP